MGGKASKRLPAMTAHEMLRLIFNELHEAGATEDRNPSTFQSFQYIEKLIDLHHLGGKHVDTTRYACHNCPVTNCDLKWDLYNIGQVAMIDCLAAK